MNDKMPFKNKIVDVQSEIARNFQKAVTGILNGDAVRGRADSKPVRVLGERLASYAKKGHTEVPTSHEDPAKMDFALLKDFLDSEGVPERSGERIRIMQPQDRPQILDEIKGSDLDLKRQAEEARKHERTDDDDHTDDDHSDGVTKTISDSHSDGR